MQVQWAKQATELDLGERHLVRGSSPIRCRASSARLKSGPDTKHQNAVALFVHSDPYFLYAAPNRFHVCGFLLRKTACRARSPRTSTGNTESEAEESPFVVGQQISREVRTLPSSCWSTCGERKSRSLHCTHPHSGFASVGMTIHLRRDLFQELPRLRFPVFPLAVSGNRALHAVFLKRKPHTWTLFGTAYRKYASG